MAALPRPGKVHPLCEPRLVIVSILHPDPHQGVGVQLIHLRGWSVAVAANELPDVVVCRGSLSNDGQVEFGSQLIVDCRWVAQTNKAVVGVDLKRLDVGELPVAIAVLVVAPQLLAECVDDTLFSTVGTNSIHLKNEQKNLNTIFWRVKNKKNSPDYSEENLYKSVLLFKNERNVCYISHKIIFRTLKIFQSGHLVF